MMINPAGIACLEDQFNQYWDALMAVRAASVRLRRAEPFNIRANASTVKAAVAGMRTAQEALWRLRYPMSDHVGRPLFELITLRQDMAHREPARWPVPMVADDIGEDE